MQIDTPILSVVGVTIRECFDKETLVMIQENLWLPSLQSLKLNLHSKGKKLLLSKPLVIVEDWSQKPNTFIEKN